VVPFPGKARRSFKLSTHIGVVQTLGMRGAITLVAIRLNETALLTSSRMPIRDDVKNE
jgi:hypothetical protein